MRETSGEAEVLGRLVRWAEQHSLVRALVLESSRAHGQAPLDTFSDYDVLVVVSDADLQAFAEDDTWLSAYGTPLVMLHVTNPVGEVDTYGRLVLYEDHVKIDYMVWPASLLRAAVERQKLPELLDWGYRALVDKDGLTQGLPAPTRTAHIPARPTEREYLAVVEEFWWESTYVAKNLWRDDLIQAKYNIDVVMRHEVLLQMLEWRVELDHNWSWKPGPAGKGLKKYLPPELWAELETTWVGAGIEENWTALFAMTALFRRVASEVARALGYTYPTELDQGVTAYLEMVHNLPRP
jgi:aminoglycoside 6-adenylyltransferase